MKKIIEKVLGFLAKTIVKKYRPFIIGITGSVGKTSTKEAIALVLKRKFFIRASPKNYNNELGFPLTVINAKTPGKSVWQWLKIFLKTIFLVILPLKFPKVLVLEMAADKPGDIDYLVSLAPCQIGVMTALAPVHLEKFKSLENILKEKQIIVTRLPCQGWAILNGDEEKFLEIKNKIRAKIITFGFKENNDVQALEVFLTQEIDGKGNLKINGLKFKLRYQGKIIPFFLPQIIAKHQIYSVLAAVSVGLVMGLNLLEISDALKNFELPAGRIKLIKGIKNSLIIDDTYNSSPEALRLALDVLGEISNLPGRRKIVVIGDMLELGEISEEAHREIGRKVAEMNFNILVTIGELTKKSADSAWRKGLPEEFIFSFINATEVGKFLKEKIIYGDVILAKGSQGMRMEKMVKEIMAEPEKAKELLVRQEKEWEDKP